MNGHVIVKTVGLNMTERVDRSPTILGRKLEKICQSLEGSLCSRIYGHLMGNMLRIPPINYWFIYEPLAYMNYFKLIFFLIPCHCFNSSSLVFHRKLSHYKVSDV